MNRNVAAPAALVILLGGAVIGCPDPPPPGVATTTPSVTAATTTASTTAEAEHEPNCPLQLMRTWTDVSPDGTGMLASCFGEDCQDDPSDSDIQLWDLSKGRLSRDLSAFSTSIAAEWPSNDLLIAASGKGTGMKEIMVRNAHTFEIIHGDSHYCSYATVDPSGLRVLITGCDGQMKLFDSTTRRMVTRPEKEAHMGGDYSVSAWFSKDGKLIYVDDEDQGLQLLDGATLRRRLTAKGTGRPDSGDEAAHTAQSPSGKAFLLAKGTGELELLDGRLSPKGALAPKGTFEGVEWLSFIDEDRAQIKTKDGKLSIFDLPSKKVAQAWAAAEGSKCSQRVDMGHARKIAAVTRADCTVSITGADLVTSKWVLPSVAPAKPDEPPQPTLTWSPDDHYLAAIHDERLVIVYDAETGKELGRLQLPAGMSQLSSSGSFYRNLHTEWTPDSRFLIAAQGDVFLIRAADGAYAALTMFFQSEKSASLVSNATQFDGPPELEPCVFRPARPAGAAKTTRTQAPGLLAQFLAGR